MMQEKRCYRCGIAKPISDFGKDSRSKDGLNGCCKTCKKAFNASYHSKPGVKERHTEYLRDYRKAHPLTCDYDRKYAHDYRAAHPEYSRKHSARQRAKKYNCIGDITEAEIIECLKFFDYKCAYSGISLDGDYQLDHIIPLSKGGENTIHNIVPSSKENNLSKSDRDFEGWYKSHTTFNVGRYNKIKEWMNKGRA